MSFQALGRSVRSSRLAARHVVARAARSQVALAAARPSRAFSALQSAALQQRSSQRSQTPTVARAFSSVAAEAVPVPSMGDSISEGTVVEWLKAPGDFVEADEVVVVIETDKVSVDVRAPFSGVLEAQLAQIDENVLVGAPLFSVVKQAAGSAPAAAAPAAAASPVKEAAAPAGEDLETINVPSMGDSISEGTIVTILKNVGDYVRADEAVLIVETDKVSVDVNAPVSGKLTSVLAKLEDVVEVGSPLFVIDKAAPAPAESATPAPTPAAAPAAATTEKAPVSSPPSTPTKVAAATPSAPATGRYNRNETRVQMSALKMRASHRLKDTQNSAAMLSTFQECDLGNLIALRDELGETFEKTHGVKLGIMSSFLKASAQALQRIPAANSFIDMDAKEIVYNDFVDINVAVASERGVVMPVIRNVEKLSVVDIEKTLTTLGQQARDGTLALEDLAGGTFTVSNSGVNGALLSTSMLAVPQSAVLGVHGVKMRPTVHAGKVVPRPMMFLSLTYDHRIIDGREGVTVLKSIAEAISDPRRLLLDM
ncbi:Dihydrolipoyllysine-residue succinyltransferase component of 2-oxoglutarate dehydrogenase complex [Phytophthora rubi]|uniref:Dihydrolipoamide acetyltransferase component of pyruvate dehydrogenase complex n=1 Tax=Phytophthora rubi TaxID=129364 RepID=A0A6A3IDI5_9STRA|nr:Dihydrolipoyllysine-residue succinyltransferase component of 2-oxoglutarate dehydrogenase complex [Phytophthora rubi]KAE8981096.1 Dihydrolipoyllysine-residue succinyltransferase component of 2-oxoglutarate dehydrogenase complex [Phytophthora rubi]KAE9353458.1 Dihydrolipoyllysine-residue succinyltransferase component of 2-oxoglutarate dehydrogenase complex [Phytophthora rubi]